MLILGFNGGNRSIHEEEQTNARHDAAAVLLKDGEVVAAIEEERLDRLKHSNCFPEQAIRFCLRQAGVSLAEVDVIATNTARATVRRWAVTEDLTRNQVSGTTDEAEFLSRNFKQSFEYDAAAKLFLCPHHLAHAASAFVPSGFDSALVLALDGDGDGISGCAMLGRPEGMVRLREYGMQQSLGHLYAEMISLLGYGIFDEYKAMGLAPYGDPEIFSSFFSEHYCLQASGEYVLAPLPVWLDSMSRAGLLGQIRKRGAEFSRVHRDFAAALQQALERIVLHVVQHLSKATGQKQLCLAGGVAHNCTMNGRLLQSGLFRNIFVQPASHDAGGSLGAALEAHRAFTGRYPAQSQKDVYWGSPLPDDAAILQELTHWHTFLSFERMTDLATEGAALLAEGAVLGWVQGRSEFGPRALGNRSILADPRPAENKQRINAMIKKREGYRPFAPSVQEEHVQAWFDTPGEARTLPYMNFVVDVKPEKHQLLGAITHVNGTARIQTVTRASNELYWNLIDAFRQRTGIPILLNTSFNGHAEPIVNSVGDAIVCFLTTGLDYLVVGTFLARKRDRAARLKALLHVVVSVMPGHELQKRCVPAAANGTVVAQTSFVLRSRKGARLRRPSIDLSPAMYLLLESTDGTKTAGELLKAADMPETVQGPLLLELEHLWTERMVVLSPA